METFKRSHCFLCLSKDPEEALVRKEEVVKTFETSCQYLIDKDEVRKGVLRLFEDDRERTEGLEVVLCSSCGEVTESVQELHLELEEIRRRLLGRVKVLKDIVVQNSRLYGTNGRAKKDLEELEEWVETEEKLGRRSVEAEKRFLKLLHVFQTLVFEKDLKVLLSPTVTVDSSEDAFSTAKQCFGELVHEEIDPDDDISPVEMEDTLSVKEEVDIKVNSNEVWDPSTKSFDDKKLGKAVRSTTTSRYGRSISSNRNVSNKSDKLSNTKESSGTDDSLTEAQRLAVELRNTRRFRPLRGKQFSCILKNCSFTARGSPRFERHLREEHETSEKNFTCPDCRHEFTNKDMLHFHVVFHCGLLTVNCHLCSVAIAPKDVKDHLESTHNLESLHHCHFCRMCFGHYVGLVDHLTSHGMVSFSCVECGNEDSTFTHPEYVQHLFQAHGNGDARISSVIFPCDFLNCTDFFLNLADLIKHKKIHQTKHQKEAKHFRCDDCDKTFSKRSHFNSHKAKHDRQKLRSRFNCDLCPKEYALQKNLTDHKLQVHGVGVLKTYECQHCHKKFPNSCALWKHRQIHREEKRHVCDTCGYATNHGQLFKDHLLTHGGPLNYFCSHCPKAFCNQRQLRNHLRYHSDPGDKLECDLCDFVGINRYSIYSHKKTSHGSGSLKKQRASKM